jgi:hypothetical protein
MEAGAALLALWVLLSLSSFLRLVKSKERQVEMTSTSNASEDDSEKEEEEEGYIL